MSSLVPLRAELAAGDLRALYLGWLAGIRKSGFDDDDSDGDAEYERPDDELSDANREPPVPAGLGQLSASLEALADFLRLDQDLLAVAAERSAPRETAPRADWERWLRGLPEAEKDAYLLRLVANGEAHLRAEITQRFRRETAEAKPAVAQTDARRAVAELRRLARQRSER